MNLRCSKIRTQPFLSRADANVGAMTGICPDKDSEQPVPQQKLLPSVHYGLSGMSPLFVGAPFWKRGRRFIGVFIFIGVIYRFLLKDGEEEDEFFGRGDGIFYLALHKPS